MSKRGETKQVPKLDERPSWLENAHEVNFLLSQTRPLRVHQLQLTAERPLLYPQMTVAEWHPFCEFSYIFEGSFIQHVGHEKMEKKSGDVMLLSSGIPHCPSHIRYPIRSATVYFLPMLLLELGPEGDGTLALSRFTGTKRITDRIVHLPPGLNQKIASRFEEMLLEFAAWKMGSELRLRALLIECIVDLLRWEKSAGRMVELKTQEVDWREIDKALRFIFDHYAEPLYVGQIANAAGTRIARLQSMFQNTFEMSCIQYLRSYRISRAAELLSRPGARVTEVALATGFETLSHFNTSFHSLRGLSPRAYVHACRKKNPEPA
jgi:AraC-like DNA-binding protein